MFETRILSCLTVRLKGEPETIFDLQGEIRSSRNVEAIVCDLDAVDINDNDAYADLAQDFEILGAISVNRGDEYSTEDLSPLERLVRKMAAMSGAM